MKFLHLSDLHIGIRVNEFSMIEDQKYIFKKIMQCIQEEKPAGIILAGDIYDKPVPSAEAVQVFDDFITKIAELKIPVFIISGNHDSPERISFGANLFKNSNVFVAPVFNGTLEPVTLQDSYGEVQIYLLPFVKPANVKVYYPEETIHTYQDAIQCLLEHTPIDTGKRNILVAHQFVTGAKRSDSEDINVGGVDNIDGALFEPFDYVALGHIHRPQWVWKNSVRYCGTPLKYSFSEANHNKSISMINLKEKGNLEFHEIPLIPYRDLREIKDTYWNVTDRNHYISTNTQDYIHITLTDEEDIPDAIGKLRSIYPNIMKLDYDNARTRTMNFIETASEIERKTDLELFAEFYFLQNNQELSEEQINYTRELLEKTRERER